MASSKSWFEHASSSKSRLLSASNFELPRWRTPSPMSASMIPPPIVQSSYSLPPKQAPAESTVADKPSIFQGRQHELEADLQWLLDVQAEGLTKGLEGGSLDDRSSNGSTTPTLQSVRSASRKKRKPIQRPPSLRSARKGIYNSVLALCALKEDELRDVEHDIQATEGDLERIDDWEEKREGLREASKNVESSEGTIRTQRLTEEAEMLQVEINQVELQLAEMKSRRRKMLEQVSAVENSVQARMASYTSSLRLLEEDIQKFLSITPAVADKEPVGRDGKQSMWQLPAQRRNLDMAREYLNEQRELRLQQRIQHEHEKSALIEGASLWKDAVTEITAFEKRLRGEMTAMRPPSPSSQTAWDEPPVVYDSAGHLRELLATMDDLIGSLQRKHQAAEEKGWRLLIAAIGAELDALWRGKDILAGVFGSTNEDRLVDVNGHGHGLTKVDSGDEIHALDKSFETARPLGNAASSTGDDHDEPDPELLFSRDTDTE